MKSIHTYLHCMGIALSVLIISVPLMHVQAYQLPESTDTELPTLFPAPREEGLPLLPQQTMDLPAVTDIVWASILQTAQKDNEIAEMLNDVPVLLSGILEIHGKDHLYLGIERSYHNTHGSTNIAELLNKKFPGVPIYIEASDGVQTQAAKQEERTTIFSENFENGLTEWTSLAFFSEGWLAHKENNNTTARAQSCAWGCVLNTKQTINLENYDEVTLTFERWTKNSSLAVQINNETIKQYTGDSTQKTETITIDSRNNARISFVATGDTAAVDNITITGTRAQEEIIEITQLTASTTTPTTGSTITLTATITGNTATTQTLQFYRHRSPTNDPTTGGTRLSTSTVEIRNPNESITKTITTTTPTVTETTRYYYYACIDDTCSEPATIQVQPTSQEPETPEDTTVTITSITATPTNPESGTPVTMQFTVQNNGTTTLNPKTVLVYQHRSPTNNPTTGARIVQSATTETLNPNESTTKTITIIAPTVTETTRYYYYYACIDDTCSEPATVLHVQLPPPEPPYEDCWGAPNRRVPMGGDKVIRGVPSIHASWYASWQTHVGGDEVTDDEVTEVAPFADGCTTITLGGLETNDGTRGFVMSGHGADKDKTPFQTPDDTYFSRDWDEYSFDHDRGGHPIKSVLGKVFKMPRIRTEGVAKYLIADAAFIAYPQSDTLGCSVTWRYENKTYCFDTGQGEYTETVVPLTIRGRGNNVYRVVGSQQSTKGLEVNLTGAVTGVHEEGLQVTAVKFLVQDLSSRYYFYVGVVSNSTGLDETIGGDSGSPIYTVPDEDGTVRIVGVHHGVISLGEGDESMIKMI